MFVPQYLIINCIRDVLRFTDIMESLSLLNPILFCYKISNRESRVDVNRLHLLSKEKVRVQISSEKVTIYC